MNLRRAGALGALALAAVAACKPVAQGRCNETKNCREGAYCSLDHICLARSGTCSPACGDGEICSGSTCAALMPVVSVQTPSGPLSAALPQVTVHVDAAAALVLHGLSVRVDSSDKTVASGSLDAPRDGDNLVVLGQFAANTVGTVSVRATLRYSVPGAQEEVQVSSVAVPASVDTAAPSVTVFVPAATDAVNGWVPRTSGSLEVRATVDDGAGSGAHAASLSFDTCPAASACVYPGTVLSQAGGATVFSFLVPRTSQAAGSEAPLAVTVKATDVAGNPAQASVALQIDDAAPVIGSVTVVSPAGFNGEDGKTWFQGGTGAPDVEIAVAVSDSGSGLASPALTLHLTDADMAGLDPAGVPQGDGTVHFLLPASHVQGREGAMRFSLTAKDQLGLTAVRAANQINVDAKPPVFTVPHVDYTSAAPAGACGPADLTGAFGCGRRGGTHALRDDTVTVTFDGFDCGAGLSNSGGSLAGLSVTSGGQTRAAGAQQVGKDSGLCGAGSGNKLHHFSAKLSLAEAVVALDPADAGGTAQVVLASTGPDRAGNGGQSAAGTSSPDGIALVSTWRWKVKLPNLAAGSPALLPGTPGARAVVVGTTGTSGANLFAIGPDGSPLWNATLVPDIVGDVAVGQNGTVYASTDASCGAASTAVNAVQPPSGQTGTPVPCAASSANFGASVAVANNSGSDLIYAIATSHCAGGNNLFAFTPGTTCALQGTGTLVTPVIDDVTGVSAGAGAALVSNSHGFTSVDQTSGSFGTQVQFEAGADAFKTLSPPSISLSSSSGSAIFGTGGGDQKLRRTVRQSTGCGAGGLSACWHTVPNFPQNPSTAPSNLPYTPVFDGTSIWAIDDQGVVFTWAQLDGTAGPFLDLKDTASPPVLLQGGAALVVTSSGLVKLLSASGAPASISAQRLVDFGNSFPGVRVPAPVLDCRAATCSGSGVAYAPAPSGWLWAVQLPAAPLAASPTVWPRPGHDSCNTRNGAETWCP